MEQLITEEEAVTDYSVTREYVFCDGRSFVIGTVDLNNEFVEVTDTHRFFPVRPNMHVRCGETGARENSCILLGGDVQVDGTNYFGVGNNLDLTNVVFEGFTFVGANRYSVYATKPGDITFIDCEWKVRIQLRQQRDNLAWRTSCHFFCCARTLRKPMLHSSSTTTTLQRYAQLLMSASSAVNFREMSITAMVLIQR